MDKEVELNVIMTHDDPVGFWYLCSGCNKDIFLPDFDTNSKETETYNFCPYCGGSIEKINSKYNG